MSLEKITCNGCGKKRGWRFALRVSKRWYCNVAFFRQWQDMVQNATDHPEDTEETIQGG